MEIKSLDDMYVLTGRIGAARHGCKQTPDMTKPNKSIAGFLFGAGSEPLEVECTTHNEEKYKALPRTVMVSKEIGDFLSRLYLEHLKAKEKMGQKGWDATNRAIVGYILAAIDHNQMTLGEAAIHHLIGYVDGKIGEEELKKLILDADDNMMKILGSYRLSRNKDGNYELTRGKWFVYKVTEDRGGGQTWHTVDFYYAGLKEVGMDPKLFPDEHRYLATKYDDKPDKSSNIGRWDR